MAKAFKEGREIMRESRTRTRRGAWLLMCAVLSGLAMSVDVVPADAAETFPSRPIELVVPYPPGGGTDIVARMLAEAAEPILKQKIVVINKPGASGTIGLAGVADARPDGYTLAGISNAPLTMAPTVLKVRYTPDDFSYVTMLAKGGQVFAVRSEFPAKTAAEFFELAAKNPGKFTYGGDGVGNIVHFSGERVFQPMKVKLRFVPFGGGGDTIKAVLGGHVDVYGGSLPVIIAHVKSGKIRPLFITMRDRVEALPDTPGIKELGHGASETAFWRGVLGPKGIPADRIAILEKAFQQAVQTQKVKDQLRDLGEGVILTTGKEFEQHARDETAEMAKIAKELGLSPK